MTIWWGLFLQKKKNGVGTIIQERLKTTLYTVYASIMILF